MYLARLDPARGAEVGKLRPVVVLTAQEILDVEPPFVFVCPLSSRSDPAYEALHVKLAPVPTCASKAMRSPSIAAPSPSAACGPPAWPSSIPPRSPPSSANCNGYSVPDQLCHAR